MAASLNSIFTFLTTSEGSLVYHIVLVFSIITTLQSAFFHARSSGFPQAKRAVFGLAILISAPRSPYFFLIHSQRRSSVYWLFCRPSTWRVLAELDGLPRDFMFVDDNLVADPEWAKRLFRAMAPLRKRWVAQAPLEIVDDPELLDLARKAGCIGLFVGIETLSEENLRSVEKGFNDAGSYRRRVAALRRAGIGIIVGVIVGLDGDDRGTFERLLRFLRIASIDAVQVNILTPLPGTKLHNRFDHDGRILSKDWSLYDYRHGVIRPRLMSAAEVQDGAEDRSRPSSR